MTWKAWAETDPGKKRENNEDRILCEPERGIFVVVDGMGGEAAGEVAAQQAVDFIKSRLHQETGTAARRLREAIAGANNEIYRLAERNPQWKGMACVLTAVVIEDGFLHIGHVGDSRLYYIRDYNIR
jgi:PPM family protein phosphatase